jgi:hypothetical protein
VVLVLVLVLPLALALALALALRVVVREMIQNHRLTKGLQREEAEDREGNDAWQHLQISW